MSSIPKSHTKLAHQIVEYLKQHDLRTGERIREQPIADHFSVSRTPVRGALAMLAAQGVLDYVPKQGYSLARPTGSVSSEDVALPVTEEEQLFRTVMRDRMANRLDDQITVTDVIRRYGSRRSVVSRMLGQMNADGLIARGTGQNWIFGPALDSRSVVEDSFRFRLLSEPAAILEPTFHMDAALLHQIRQQHISLLEKDMDTVEAALIYDADAAFHNAIADSCHNQFFTQALRQQTRLRGLSGSATNMNRHRLSESCREHLRILDAIEAGDRERASELMRLHLRASQELRPRLSIRGVPPLARKGR